MARITYGAQMKQKYISLLREKEAILPPYCTDFFVAIDGNASAKTQYSYACDLLVFFRYLKEIKPQYASYEIKDFTPEDLESVTLKELQQYQQYLKSYDNGRGQTIENDNPGIIRKLSTLRSFYYQLSKIDVIKINPTIKLQIPRPIEKTIIRLDEGEAAALLDVVESGTPSSNYKNKNRLRDLAIVTTLLGTGLRVSELVGLDLEDIDFREDRLKVLRKGGNESFVYFNDEVESAIRNYLNERNEMTPKAGHEHALFLSTQKKRINIKTVENMVKRYAIGVTPKNITPHKLRSTYGTNLYRSTGDIYVVAASLGHKNVDTTRKHYAAMDDDTKRRAARSVKLREP